MVRLAWDVDRSGALLTRLRGPGRGPQLRRQWRDLRGMWTDLAHPSHAFEAHRGPQLRRQWRALSGMWAALALSSHASVAHREPQLRRQWRALHGMWTDLAHPSLGFQFHHGALCILITRKHDATPKTDSNKQCGTSVMMPNMSRSACLITRENQN